MTKISHHKRLIWENYTNISKYFPHPAPDPTADRSTLLRLKQTRVLLIYTRWYIYLPNSNNNNHKTPLRVYIVLRVRIYTYAGNDRVFRAFLEELKVRGFLGLLYDGGRLRWKSFVFCYQPPQCSSPLTDPSARPQARQHVYLFNVILCLSALLKSISNTSFSLSSSSRT